MVKKTEVKKVLKRKGGSKRGIGKFVNEYIMDCVNKDKELDVKELDGVLFEKFGISKSGSKSRKSSIYWYINKMKDDGLFVE